jgi:hypothetical protein
VGGGGVDRVNFLSNTMEIIPEARAGAILLDAALLEILVVRGPRKVRGSREAE